MKKSQVFNKMYFIFLKTLRFSYWRFMNLKSAFIKIPSSEENSHIVDLIKDYNKIRPFGPKRNICYAPMNNILFSKEGKILTCSYNQKYTLGTYPKENIKNILEGEHREQLIEKHKINDLHCGCEYCLNFIESKKYLGLKPLTFDKYSKGFKISQPKVLEFDLSSRCNLNCIMCNEIDRGTGQLNDPYDDNFIEELIPYLKHIKEAKFYGGEPFMIPQYFKIWQKIVSINPKAKIFVITNGTLLSEQSKQLLEKGRFEIGVSIDSLDPLIFGQIRVGASFSKVIENIHWYVDYCKRKRTNLSLSMTIFRMNWKEIPAMIDYCNELKCSIFFSYLYNPEHFSLWTLPSIEIDEIINYLSGFDFPKLTANEIYNHKCYQDIIEHLKYWKKKNLTIVEEVDKDYLSEWMLRLAEHFRQNDRKDLIDPEVEVLAIKNKLELMITESGYTGDVQKIYKEINKMDIESFLMIYNNTPAGKLKLDLNSWLINM